MKNIVFDTEHAGVRQETVLAQKEALKNTIREVQKASEHGYDSLYASVHAPFDMTMHNHVKRIVATKKSLQPHIVVVIGIGGSNLGTMAVHHALHGRLYNEKSSRLKIYFADTVDEDYIKDIYELIQVALQQGKTVLLNVVSKSGTTTETVANFYIFFELLRSFYPHDYHKYVVVTSDKDSLLHICAQKHDFTFLEIPKQVGGRYSLFSPVGLFPLGMLNINIDELLHGARTAIEKSVGIDDANNAAQTAAIRAILYNAGVTINDLFLFSVDCEDIGKWYRQLMGESIGKEHDIHGAMVERGIMPTISMGTVDLHSVGQLYLGGPRDKLFVFLDIISPQTHIYIPSKAVCDLSAQVVGKSIGEVHHAIFTGVQRAFAKTNRPFISIGLPEKNPFYIGQLLQYMMVEIMFLGTLLELNPFDQPNVELYKQETRKILDNA